MKSFYFSIVLSVLFSMNAAMAGQSEYKIACKAASQNMPNGNGATVYYPNGNTLTHYAGQSGVTWYYPNGQTLTSYMGVPGATFYYSNGRIFSHYTGNKGATWYYAGGKEITSYGPALKPQEMAELACDLIMQSLKL
jgi:hypothetical protein